MVSKVLFSSATDLWATPQDTFDVLNAEFGFELDVCALSENAKCAAFFTPEVDGLGQDWGARVCWMNPPYGEGEQPCKPNCKKKRCRKRRRHNHAYRPGIADWVRKAWDSAQAGATVVCLLPVRSCTAWWHDYVETVAPGDKRFIRGRLKFGGSKNSAPFPSVVVIFRPPAVAARLAA